MFLIFSLNKIRSTNSGYDQARQIKNILFLEAKFNLRFLLQTMLFTVSFVLNLATSSPCIHVQTSTSSTGWVESGLTMPIATLHSPFKHLLSNKNVNFKAY